MDFLNSPTAALVIKFVAAFAVVLVLIFAAMWIFRFIRGAGLGIGGSGRSRQPRLAVLDFTDVDSRRRLVLIRRDNVEHLILLGGPTDVVVETNIIRGQAAVPNPARDLDPALPVSTADSQIMVPVEPPRSPLRDVARAAAGEGLRAAPTAETEAAPPSRAITPGRSLFNSFSTRREPAPPPPAAPAPVTEAPKLDMPKEEAPKVEAVKVDAPKFEAPKIDAPLGDDISAKLDAALRKPLTVSAPAAERRPLPAAPPPRPTPPPARPPEAVEPVRVEPSPIAPPAPEPEATLSPPTAPASPPPSASIPAPPLRAPLFTPPPLRAKPEAVPPEPVISPPPIPAPPAPASVRGPATPPLTASERSVFDSLEEEMASLLGRSPKSP